MKKRKEEILRNKEQSTVQSTEQPSVQSTEQSSVQSTVQSTAQPSLQSNNTYVCGVGILAVLTIGVCVFFTYNTFQPFKKLINDRLVAQHKQKQDQPPKRLQML